MDIRQHWKGIRTLAASFDREAAMRDASEENKTDKIHLDKSQVEVWLVSVTNESLGSVGGRVVTAFPMVAAGWLKTGTHVLATEDQIKAHRAELEQRRMEINAAERDRKGANVPPEMVELAKAASALAAAAQQPPPQRGAR